MADGGAPVTSGQNGSTLTARWTGPLDERSAAALAKALACLGDTNADPQRQWMALLRLSGHAAPDRDDMWKSHVMPRLGDHARAIDGLRRMLAPPAPGDHLPDLGTIERLMRLCRRMFKVAGSEPLLADLLDRVAYALCALTIRTPYLAPEETRGLAEMPEIVESLDVLLQRGNDWPGTMLQTSLVILAHADSDGASDSRRILRLLPALGRRAARNLASPEVLADGLHVLLMHPTIATVETGQLVAGRLARRLCATGHGHLVVRAMDLSQPASPTPAVGPGPDRGARIKALAVMTSAIVEAMASTMAMKGRPGHARPFSNVVALAKHVKPLAPRAET